MSKLLNFILLLIIQIVLNLKQIEMVQEDSLDNKQNLNISNPTSVIKIERMETFPNGCYKQRTIEPDLWNTRRFFETEQLICPPTVNASAMTFLSQQLQRNNSVNHTANYIPANNTPTAVLPIPAVPLASAIPSTIQQAKNHTHYVNYPHNSSHVSHVAPNLHPANFTPISLKPPPAVSSASHPVVLTQHKANPTVMKPSNTTSHAVILSKKTGFYGHGKRKSSANSLNNFNCLFVFVVITTLFNCNRHLLRQQFT